MDYLRGRKTGRWDGRQGDWQRKKEAERHEVKRRRDREVGEGIRQGERKEEMSKGKTHTFETAVFLSFH